MLDDGERWRIVQGDCREVMGTMGAESVDSIVTDPPYGLSFMGKGWDHGVPGVDFWAEALRVAKPGAHLLAFGGTRTFHRLTCAIEDAGWEIRDCIMWVYGSGFPKSLDVSKAIDKAAGVRREAIGTPVKGKSGPTSKPGGGAHHSDDEYGFLHRGSRRRVYDEWPGEYAQTAPATPAALQWAGWGTALKPAWEPIIVARKPIVATVAANVQAHGTGGLNIDACRVALEGEGSPAAQRRASARASGNAPMSERTAAETDAEGRIGRRGSADVYMAERPGEALGRWPANLVHDGSDEVVELFPGGDSSSAARFFYCAKASKEDRDEGLDGLPLVPPYMVENGSKNAGSSNGVVYERHTLNRNVHPTVKPTALMRYLCRLVTQPGGVVLDPFCGSGSTGKAALLEGFRFIGCELQPEYATIARTRCEHALAGAAPEDVAVSSPSVKPQSNQLSLFESAGG